MKKRLKYIVIATVIAVAALLALPLLIYVPPIQRWLVNEATEIASEQTGMDISIEGVSLCFPLDLSLDGVLVKQEGDTIANIGSAVVDIQLLPLLDGHVAVDILDVKVADRGVAATDDNGCHVVPGVIPRTKIIEIEDGMADFNGIRFPIDPMIGVMGLAPAGEAVPCLYPANHGGNMDSKLIRKGSRVYFPVRVEGGLLQMGDIHAVMGDCEICGTGIEIPGEITVRISLIKAFELNFPLTETDTHWYVNGSGKDYQEALQNASTEMNRLIAKATGWDVTDSFIYMSLQCDIELNQACDPGEFPADIRIGVKKSSGIELI